MLDRKVLLLGSQSIPHAQPGDHLQDKTAGRCLLIRSLPPRRVLSSIPSASILINRSFCRFANAASRVTTGTSLPFSKGSAKPRPPNYSPCHSRAQVPSKYPVRHQRPRCALPYWRDDSEQGCHRELGKAKLEAQRRSPAPFGPTAFANGTVNEPR